MHVYRVGGAPEAPVVGADGVEDEGPEECDGVSLLSCEVRLG